jgi:hypothetical protein
MMPNASVVVWKCGSVVVNCYLKIGRWLETPCCMNKIRSKGSSLNFIFEASGHILRASSLKCFKFPGHGSQKTSAQASVDDPVIITHR